jgi:hypothetical protein
MHVLGFWDLQMAIFELFFRAQTLFCAWMLSLQFIFCHFAVQFEDLEAHLDLI